MQIARDPPTLLLRRIHQMISQLLQALLMPPGRPVLLARFRVIRGGAPTLPIFPTAAHQASGRHKRAIRTHCHRRNTLRHTRPLPRYPQPPPPPRHPFLRAPRPAREPRDGANERHVTTWTGPDAQKMGQLAAREFYLPSKGFPLLALQPHFAVLSPPSPYWRGGYLC